MAAAAVSFSDLPTEALDEIARRVGPLDSVMCSAVCKPWRRALKTTRLRRLRHPNRPHYVCLQRWYSPAWATMSKEARESSTTKVCVRPMRASYYSKDILTTVLDYRDGCARPKRIIGGSYGWLVVADEDCGLSLLEPLSGRRFPLPPITSSHGRIKKLLKDLDQMGPGIFHKAALVPGRRLGTFAVMLIHSAGHGLSFLAPGSKSWTTLRDPAWSPKSYLDVVFHKGVFYTVSLDSELNAWVPDGSSTGLKARLVACPRTKPVWAVLVESTTRDDLLMVSAPKSSTAHQGGPFEVSRYDEHGARWIPVTYNEETNFFVGASISFCISKQRILNFDQPTCMETGLGSACSVYGGMFVWLLVPSLC